MPTLVDETTYYIEDLGEIASGDGYCLWRPARCPRTGVDLAIGALSHSGFMIVDPASSTMRHVRSPHPLKVAWPIGQVPNGDIYLGDGEALYRWDWQGDQIQSVMPLPDGGYYMLGHDAEGRVYLPNYHRNCVFRYDPQSDALEDVGSLDAFGQHGHDIYPGNDGLLYIEVRIFGDVVTERSVMVALDPQTLEMKAVEGLYGYVGWSHFGQDGEGRVFVMLGEQGKEQRYEISHGKVQPAVLPVLPKLPVLDGVGLHLRGGGYLKTGFGVIDVTIGDAKGNERTLTAPPAGSPLELFNLAAGGGKIWVGTILPLNLVSFDPETGESTSWGNPTASGGEIYNMAFANGKLFMGVYPKADVRCFDPSQPTEIADRSLGLISCNGSWLHRPHGCTNDGGRHIFFAAHGSYGVDDSGIAKVDIETEEMVNWGYPATAFFALVHCKATGELLLSESRKGEKAVRFTLISPQDGSILWSEPMWPGGGVVSWLDGGDDWVYGLHANTATIFAFSLSERKIVAQLREMCFGNHKYNSLVDGLDGRIWGVTDEGVFAVTRDLEHAEKLASLEESDLKQGVFYRFGAVYDEAGRLYFVNGSHLMRMVGES